MNRAMLSSGSRKIKRKLKPREPARPRQKAF